MSVWSHNYDNGMLHILQDQNNGVAALIKCYQEHNKNKFFYHIKNWLFTKIFNGYNSKTPDNSWGKKI